jgi:DNA polymerase-3 subunit alpha
MLGLYVSDHPLLGVEHILATGTDCSLAQLVGSADDELDRGSRPDREAQVVTVGGILSGVQRKVTRQGSTWATATLEDLEGAIEVLFFPATYAQCMSQVLDDAIVVVRGRLDRREEVPKLVAMEVSTPDISAGDTGPFVVSMPEVRCIPPVIERLKEALRTHPGPTEVHLRLISGGRVKVLRLDDKLRVKPSPSLLADLKQLLGPGCVA